MQAAPSHSPAQAFFMEADRGRRFCLYHPPLGRGRGAVLHVPAHAEEMNKSRRMVARQARLLAANGIGVLLLDLYGCGDSEGLSADARWEIWRQDVALALQWLRAHADGPLSLWGLRLGGLLALDAAQGRTDLESILLWQPVTEGAAYLTQFLRLRLAADMLTSTASAADTKTLRETLAGGASLDIAGYTIAPGLAQAFDAAGMDTLAAPACPVHWLDLVPQPGRPMAPGRVAIARRLVESGWTLDASAVHGPAFWSTQEIAEAPALLDASAALLGAEAG